MPETIAVVVTALGVAGGVVRWWLNGIRAERIRLKKLYADAFSAITEHQQFPYMIHRRRAPTPTNPDLEGEERLRIAEALNVVQEAFNNYRAQIWMESHKVSKRYEELVETSRSVTGRHMKDAWEKPPAANDASFPHELEFKLLDLAKDLYLGAARQDTSFMHVAFRSLPSRTSKKELEIEERIEVEERKKELEAEGREKELEAKEREKELEAKQHPSEG